MLPLRDKIRAITHQLKMETLLNVDPLAVPEMRSRISKLPSPEEIAQISHKDLLKLRSVVDHLVFDIDKLTNSRSKNRALRELSYKGLPPFRKPLLAKNWYFLSKKSD
jgi:hypothetical protein